MLKAFDEGKTRFIGYVIDLKEQMQHCLADIGTLAEKELRTLARLDMGISEGLSGYYAKGVYDAPDDPDFQRLQKEYDANTPPKIRRMIELLERVRNKMLGIIPLQPSVKPRIDTTTKRSDGRTGRRAQERQGDTDLSPSERRARTTAKLIEELGRLKPLMTGTEADYAELKSENPRFLTFRVAARHPELKEKVLNLQDHIRYIRLAQELAAAHHGRALSTVQTDWKKRKHRKTHNPKR